MKLSQEHLTSVSYSRPYRPAPVALFNSFGRGLERLGVRADLSVDGLLGAACRAERTGAFRDISFVEPLRVLLDSVEREARLSPLGRLVTRARLIGLLRNRLRVEALLERHPEIAHAPLPPVILITGLQRTGTTLLHRLLAADTDNRALLSWEAINPLPPIRPGQRDRREHVARTSCRVLTFLAPDFFAVHPVEHDAPEEDVLLLDYALLSTVPESTLHVPSYSRWVETQDHRPAYEYMASLLRILQWQRPGRRWILKSPHHLEFLDAFLAVFRDVVIVQTHRDPTTTIASFSSMISHGRGIFSDAVDPRGIGASLLRKTSRMVSRGMATRRSAPDELFVDIYYEELVRDPIRQVERIYERCGIALDGRARSAIERSLDANQQYRYGRHRYQLDYFGLTEEMIRERFSEYYRAFGLGQCRAA